MIFMINQMLLHYSLVIIIVFMFNIMMLCIIFFVDYETNVCFLKETQVPAVDSGYRKFKQNSGFLLDHSQDDLALFTI